MKLLAQIGTITPPDTIPTLEGEDPSTFIAGFVQAGIQLLLIVSFVAALFWTIFAGYRFITSGGDPKSTGQAWSQIYWGLIGIAVVVGSFALLRLVETFFNVNIITTPGGFHLPSNP